MIDKNEIKHIAHLARVGLDEKEIEKFSGDLSAILDWMEDLKKADVDGVEPLGHITGQENVTREDEVSEFANRAGIIKLFPEEKNGYDKVKSVL